MNRQTKLGGTFTLPGTSLNLYRMGYGAMQLAGPDVWGLPANIEEAVAVLRSKSYPVHARKTEGAGGLLPPSEKVLSGVM